MFNLGMEFGISPRLILANLMSDEDKEDLRHGRLSENELRHHIAAWKENEMPDLVGREKPIAIIEKSDRIIQYRKPFVAG